MGKTEQGREYPFMDNPGQTHWDGCWKEKYHHNCAVQKVYDLEEELARVLHIVNRILPMEKAANQFSPTVSALRELLRHPGYEEEVYGARTDSE